jgi:rhodanese-related sulfurtransferase
MGEVLRQFPAAQRALFARFHIGGCSKCAYRPEQTLEEVCRSNELSLTEVIAEIEASHAQDVKLQVGPTELAQWLNSGPPQGKLHLLDVRTREEHEAVCIAGSQLLTQELVQQAFANWEREDFVVLYDHLGTRSMDVAAYFLGHGFANTRCLAGGIDAYSREAQPTLPRYRLELD